MTAVLHRPSGAAGAARIALARTRLELRLFFRERQQVVFSFAYPVIMLVIFGSVLGGDERPGGVPFTQYFLAGIAATGIMLTSFQASGRRSPPSGRTGSWSGCSCSVPRRWPTSRARRARCWSPRRRSWHCCCRWPTTATTCPMPADPAHWLTFGWVAVLGALAGTVLGVAVSALPGSAASMTTGVSAFAIVLQFFSGVFFGFLRDCRAGCSRWRRCSR